MSNSGKAANHGKLLGLTIITLIILISSFPLDVMLPSYSSIASYFSVETKEVPLSVTVFTVGFCISQLLLGPISDRHGRFETLTYALLLATSAAIGCSMSNSFKTLLAWRFLQGIGCGCFVLANALIQDLVDKESRLKTRIFFTTLGGIFIALSPLAGSGLEKILGWRGSFYLFGLFCTITLLIILTNKKFFPPIKNHDQTERSNILRDYWSMLRNPVFLFSWLICALGFSCHFSFIVMSPLIFIDNFKLTNTTYSYILLTYGLAYLAGGLLSGRLAKTLSINQQIYVGSALIALSGCLIFIVSSANPWTILFPMLLCTFGTCLIRPASSSRAMDVFDTKSGTAASAGGTIMFLTAGITSALVPLLSNNHVTALSVLLLIAATASIFINFRLKRTAISG